MSLQEIEQLQLPQLIPFEVIDHLLHLTENRPHKYLEFYKTKKQMIKFLVVQQKITLEAYSKIVESAFNSKSPLIRKISKDCIFKPATEQQKWFDDSMTVTQELFEAQAQKYKILKSNPQAQESISGPRTVQVQIRSENADSSEDISLGFIDFQIQKNKENSEAVIRQLLQIKHKMFEKIDAKRINATQYKASLDRIVKTTTNSLLRERAQFEIDMIGSLYENKLEKWFTEIVEDSRYLVSKQQEYLRATVKSEVKKPIAPQSSFDLKELVCITQMDREIYKKKEDSSTVELILAKKMKLLDCIDSGKIEVDAYIKLIKSVESTTTNAQYKQYIEDELELISLTCGGNKTKWFRQLCMDSRELIEKQRGYTSNGGQMQEQRQYEHVPVSVPVPVHDQPPPEQEINTAENVSFTLLDEEIRRNKNNPKRMESFMKVKKDILSEVDSSQITPQNYLKLLKRILKKSTNELVREKNSAEISLLGTKYNNDTSTWFREILKNTKGELPVQQSYIEQSKMPRGKQRENLPKTISNPRKQSLDVSEFINFSALDEFMSRYEDNAEIFMKLFEKKKKLLDGYRRKELNGKTYSALQKEAKAKTGNEELREIIETDMEMLTKVHEGNVDQWFVGLLNSTAEDYQQQKDRYNQLKGNRNSNPQISNVNNFRYLDEELKHGNQQRFLALFEEKDNLMKELIRLSLDAPDQYLRIQEKIIKESSDSSQVEQAKISVQKRSKFDTDMAWFEEQINETGALFEAQKKKYEILKSHKEKAIDLPKSSFSLLPNQKGSKKVEDNLHYFFENLNHIENLFYYYTSNKIPFTNQLLINHRDKTHKIIDKVIKSIKDGTMDGLGDFCQKFLPIITPEHFYGMKMSQLFKKREEEINILKKEIEDIEKYLKVVNKKRNQRNVSDCEKMKNASQKNIQFILSLKDHKMIYYIAKEEKVMKYMIDLNELAPDELELFIEEISGLAAKLVLRVFIFDQEKISKQVMDGPQNIRIVAKLTQAEMKRAINDSEEFLTVRLSEKGFFGEKILMEKKFTTAGLLKKNIDENKRIPLNEEITFSYTIRTQKPAKEQPTIINHLQIKRFPEYVEDKQLKNKLIKLLLPYESPTSSELIVREIQESRQHTVKR